MDAMAWPSVRTGIVCASPQTGKTEAANNFVGCNGIDRAPGPVLYVFPDQMTARENSQDRIIPMIETSPRLREYLTGVDDDKSSLRIRLLHMPIYLAWAGSAARLGNKPIKYVIFDETDKYPPLASKRETDPISLGEKRVITYRYDHKILKISTPTTGNGVIWVALNTEAQEIFDYQVKCPDCGAFQVMTFENIWWPKEKGEDGKEAHPNPETLEAKETARYVCEHCGEKWNDAARDEAVTAGRWVGRRSGHELFDHLAEKTPTKIGFHLPAMVSSMVSLSAIAADFLRSKDNKKKLRDFNNARLAIPWTNYTVDREEKAILALRDDRPRGLVPPGIDGLTAGVDTQDYGFWYEIRAWKVGPAGLESWQVREGYIPSIDKNDFSGLDDVLFNGVYKDHTAREYSVSKVLIDSGGHRTSQVYTWCGRKPRICYAVRGERTMAKHWDTKNALTYPGTKIPVPGYPRRLHIDTTHFKNILAGRLEVAPADPGAWHMHSETSMEWARQMTVEYEDEKGVWQCPDGKANHAWDASVYNLAAATIFITAQKAAKEAKPKPGRRVISGGIDG